MPPEFPRKPTLPQFRRDDPRAEPNISRSPAPVMIGEEREHFYALLKDQTDELKASISEAIGELRGEQQARDRETDKRLTELERSRLEDKETRIAVEGLSSNVRTMLDRERAQDMDIGRLQAVMRPVVAAEASSEGMAAGHAAGKQVSRFWAGVGVALAVASTSVLQYCEHQAENGAFSAPLKK